jgi:O-antigen/teichoic acid export membrane protein
MMVWFFAAQLLNIGDRYVLQAFCGSTELGIYSANYSLATGLASLLSAPIMLAAFPIIMYMWTDRQRENIRKTISSMTEWYLLLGIGILGSTLVTAQDLISLVFGQAFREGHTALVPVLAGQILWQASILGHKGMELTENTKIMLKWACVAVVANFGLNILLVPSYGYLAAAYTTLFSYGLYAFLIWRSSKYYISWDIDFKSIGLASLIATLGIIVAYTARIEPVLWQAILRAGIFLIVYAAGVFSLKRKEIRRGLKGEEQ